MELENNTILVTGGAGNIGSHIIEEILKQNYQAKIIVVDNFFNGKNLIEAPNIKYFPVDISSLEEMDYIFKTYNPTYVFHCASMLIQDSEKLPRKAINTNIIGTFNVVDLSNKYNVKKICYSSSASVYGEPKYLPVDEEHPFQYENFIYGWTKISAEMIFKSNCKVDWLGFRYYNVYSNKMNQGAFYTQVFNIFYDKIKNNLPITIYGDGSQTMDLIHARDIAKANLLGMKSKVTKEFFNVGSGEETKVSKLAEIIMDIMGNKVDINYEPNDSQKVKNRRSSTEKINKLLNFTPEITPIVGLTNFIKSKNDNKT